MKNMKLEPNKGLSKNNWKLGLCFIVLTVIAIGIQRYAFDPGFEDQWDDQMMFMKVGNEIAAHGNSKLILDVDEATKQILKSVQNKEALPWVIDEDLGGGNADSTLVFTTIEAGKTILGLRLKRENKHCHLLGIWFPSEDSPKINTEPKNALYRNGRAHFEK